MKGTEEMPAGVKESLPCWAEDLGCAITVCDAEFKIIYMNRRSRDTFLRPDRPELIGHNLLDYHQPASIEIMKSMMEGDHTNCYTVEKAGVKKIIFQTPWHQEGKVAGLVEISIPLPAEVPHKVRK